MAYKDPETFGIGSSGFNAISVIIPAYQAEETIERSVTSALSIGPALREIVVVDDGSTDDTSVIVARLANCDDRVRLIRQQNKGRSAARNVGLAAAHGSWIMFLDADDYLFPGDYEVLIDAAVINDLGLIICQHSCSDAGKTEVRDMRTSLSDISVVSADSLKRVMVDGGWSGFVKDAEGYEFNAAWSRLYRHDLISEAVNRLGTNFAPFPLGLRFSEDRLFNLEYLWLLENGKVAFLPFCAYHWDVDRSATCGVVRPQDVDSLVRYAAVVEVMRDRGLFGEREARLLLAREFMGQFNRATKSGSLLSEVQEAWFRAFDAVWLREHLVECPRDSLGMHGEWRLAWELLSKGKLHAAFVIYGALARVRVAIKH